MDNLGTAEGVPTNDADLSFTKVAVGSSNGPDEGAGVDAGSTPPPPPPPPTEFNYVAA